MRVRDAVVEVLGSSTAPLHYVEITRLITDRNLWTSDSKTPEATVNATISGEIQRLGERSRFKRVGVGVYALNDGFVPESAVPVDGTATIEVDDAANAGLSFADAAERVLELFGRRRPMQYRVITREALERGLIVTAGKTPEATMYAQMYSEIQRATKRGKRPRFVMHGRGYFGLSGSAGEGLAYQIEYHNHRVRQSLLDRIRMMNPIEFEALIGQLLTAIGFEKVNVTSASGDGGVDVRGTLVVGDVIRVPMAVQVKRWKQNIQTPTVQQMRGSLRPHERGLIIST